QPLGGATRHTVITGGADARYLPTGHLVYALRGTLLAVPFDTVSLTIRGGPVPLVEGLSRQAISLAAQFAISSNGTLAYVPPSSIVAGLRPLAWVDRQGHEEVIPAPPHAYRNPRISPDGTRLALDFADDAQNEDIWVWDFARGTWTRVTSDPLPDREPAWTPDGQRIVFCSWRSGVIALFSQAANGTGTAE